MWRDLGLHRRTASAEPWPERPAAKRQERERMFHFYEMTYRSPIVAPSRGLSGCGAISLHIGEWHQLSRGPSGPPRSGKSGTKSSTSVEMTDHESGGHPQASYQPLL